VESQHDGIPDQWKVRYGLSTTDANLNKEAAPNGYTYLENYLNGTSPM
jgi:large repetitive protein